MTNSEYMVVLITAKDGEEAGFISKVLLEQKKSACINIIEGVKTIYRWNGNIESASENLLIVKTRTALLDEIIRIVKEIHSYDVPEIIALPVIGGSFDYLAWVGKETL